MNNWQQIRWIRDEWGKVAECGHRVNGNHPSNCTCYVRLGVAIRGFKADYERVSGEGSNQDD